MKRFLKLFLILFLSLASMGPAHGRLSGKARIDSLEQELNSGKYRNKEDTSVVKILAYLAYFNYPIDPDKGVKYGIQELALARKIGWPRGIARAYDDIAVNYQYKSDYSNAFKYYDSSLKAFEQLTNKGDIAGVVGNIGYAYTLSGDFAKALDYDQRSLKLFEEAGDKRGVVNALGNIGSLYMNKGDYPKALDYSFRALKINEEMNVQTNIASNLGTIGSIYTLMQDYPQALDYYIKAVKLNSELGKKNALAGNYANIGSVYTYQQNYPSALEYSFRALDMYQELGNKTNTALVLGNIGQIYQSLHNYPQAIAFLFRALQIAKETGDKNAEAGQMGMIGQTYFQLVTDTIKNNDIVVSPEFYSKPNTPNNLFSGSKKTLLHKALMYETSAIALEKEVGNLDYLQQFYHNLSEIDSSFGDYKGALDAFEQYKILNDSVFNGNNRIAITNLETKRELDLKDKQIQIDKQAIDLKDKQIEIDKLAVEKKRNEREFFIAGIALLLLVIVFVAMNYYGQKRSNRLLLKEKKRSEDLLLNILPAEVAEELKEKGSAHARQYDNVTVILTDFVEFTKAGERMNAQQLVSELDTCFKAFDEIITRHNIEKIKTVGDAYLAVAGLPSADPKHAENIINAAQDIRAYMNDRQEKLGNNTFSVRIGINSGSVVAGIVGSKKFAYDIWGDTVNITARMEQNSEPGRINISENTYELVKEKFACEYRGEVVAKHKGELKMYFVE